MVKLSVSTILKLGGGGVHCPSFWEGGCGELSTSHFITFIEADK